MSRDELKALSADERALVERLQMAPPETASAAGRERALRAFVQGEGATFVLHPSRVHTLRWTGLVAAAALLAMLVIFGALPQESWRVTDVVNPDGVRGFGGTVAVGTELDAGLVATGPESELELQLGEDLNLRLVGGSMAELPPGPGRWFGRQRTLRLRAGEVYGTSAGHPLGWKLSLAGRDAVGTLTGTTFAIFLREETTCFCLYEGSLQVEVLATGEIIDLPVGQRVWVWGDGRKEIKPLDARETMKLQMSRDRGLQPPPADE
jgi:ferric-dicitrate binding protein FerR (iron transport regulator)